MWNWNRIASLVYDIAFSTENEYNINAHRTHRRKRIRFQCIRRIHRHHIEGYLWPFIVGGSFCIPAFWFFAHICFACVACVCLGYNNNNNKNNSHMNNKQIHFSDLRRLSVVWIQFFFLLQLHKRWSIQISIGTWIDYLLILFILFILSFFGHASE